MSIWTQINDELVEYAQASYNVLLKGKKGIGKTSIIRMVFNALYGKEGVDWVMLNAATLDPYTQLIGIPFKDENNGGHIEFLTPSYMGQHLKAIFIDEINRAPTMHIQNALLELVQFKSINGKAFPNLKVVWGAFNPVGTSLGVDEILEPLVDRFEIKNFELPYKLNDEVLGKKFSFYSAFKEWWNSLEKTAPELHAEISPRNLDQMMDHYQRFNNVNRLAHTVVVDSVNWEGLKTNILEYEQNFYLTTLLSKSDEEKYAFFNLENSQKYLPHLLADRALFDALISYVNADFVVNEISKESDVGNKLKAKSVRNEYIKDIVASVEQLKKNQIAKTFGISQPSVENNEINTNDVDALTVFLSENTQQLSNQEYLMKAFECKSQWKTHLRKIFKADATKANNIVKYCITTLLTELNSQSIPVSVGADFKTALADVAEYFNPAMCGLVRLNIYLTKAGEQEQKREEKQNNPWTDVSNHSDWSDPSSVLDIVQKLMNVT